MKGFVRKVFKGLKGIAIDLIVVFVGVFAAFQLSDYKDEKREKNAKLNYFKAFQSEIRSASKNVDQLRIKVDSTLSYYEESLKKGERPRLSYQRGLFFYGKPLIVESAFNASNFSNLTSGLLASISRGTNTFYWVDERLHTYKERTKDLLYNKPYDDDLFYDQQGLKEEYQWYILDLKEISALLERLNGEIKEGALPACEHLIHELEN